MKTALTMKPILTLLTALLLALGFRSVAATNSANIISDGTLSVTLSDQGIIQNITWKRPSEAPVHMVFRDDQYAGFSWHVNIDGQWRVKLPLARVKPGANDFALTQDGITYSLAYALTNGGIEVVAGIKNGSGKDFSPQRGLLNTGLDTEMVKFPEWNQRFFPTLLRCEKTHFWGYFMRPDGIILGVASPDPLVSWANGYNPGGHRIYTSSLDLLNKDPQPARHPRVNGTLAPGESRQWKILLVPLTQLDQVQPTIAHVARIPMISLDRPTVEKGETVSGRFIAPGGPRSLAIVGPDGMPVTARRDGDAFSFKPAAPGVYTLTLTDAAGKIVEAKASCRMPWSWYLKQARVNAVNKPQKGGSHTESWYGLFSGYLARRHFPDAKLDAELDAKFQEIAPLMYDMKTMRPLSTGPAGKLLHRIQNHACFASVLVDRYQATGDIRSLEFAALLADYLITCQSEDGAYRASKSHYTSVVYIGKSILEVMAAEKPLAQHDSVWKERYDRHEVSVRRAMDELALHGDDIGTEGQATYEDGMISCSYSQLAMFALLQNDPAQRQKYLDAAKKLASGHRCLSQILIPDSRMNGGSLRYWESQYDINTAGVNMMNSPHGWSAWRLYGLWYLYQLTGEKEYLRQAMNGLGACAQLVDFQTGDLRWAFVPDPCIHTQLFEEIPDKPGQGRHVPHLVGEQYLPMISGWYRAKPNTWTVGYLGMAGMYPPGTQGGCCDNDVHEIFKCMGEIALDSAYVVENADGTLETWNCTAQRSGLDGIFMTPAEPVVSRVHFNLKKPSRVTVHFATGEQRGTITTMGWFGPGGLPQELR